MSARALSWIYWCAIAALVAYATFLLWPGIGPKSLFLDDQWVAALVKASVRDVLSTPAPEPLGLIALMRLSHAFVKDPDIGLQIVPIGCFLLNIVLIGWLGLRLTGNYGAALLIAVLFALNPLVASYAVRVKPYASDALCMTALLAAVVVFEERRSLRAFAVLCVLAAVAFFVSLMSVVLSVPAIGLLLLWRGVCGDRNQLPAMLIWAVASYTAIAVFYVAYVRFQVPQSAYDYWTAYYIPTDTFSNGWTFLATKAWKLAGLAFPPGTSWLAYVTAPSLAVMLLLRKTRVFATVCLLFAVVFIAASAMKKIPLGGGRTDIFAIPVLIVASCAGLGLVGRQTFYQYVTLGLAACVLAAIVMGAKNLRTAYVPESSDRAVVEYINNNIRDEDGLIVYPHAMWGVGYYGRWPFRLKPTPEVANNFGLTLDRPKTLVLPTAVGGQAYWDQPKILMPLVAAFIESRRPARLFFVGTFNFRRFAVPIRDAIRAGGYVKVADHGLTSGDCIEEYVRR